MTDTAEHELIEVRLLGVPIALRERSTQHGDGLLREMTLIAQQAADDSDVPARLVRLAAEVRDTYSMFTVHANAEMDAAAEAGVESVDVVYRVPRSVATMCRHILEVIEEADAYCRQGQYLLTLATPPDVLAYQRWIVGEFIRQPSGEPPLSWGDYQHRRQS
jgi:hypothetical protein